MRPPPVQEECCVLDNFYAGNFVVDDRTGHKLWTRRDASAAGFGHNFDRDELCLPPNIVELEKI